MQTKYISTRMQEYIKGKYTRTEKRLLLLDYDGTFTAFADIPSHANPG